jgi:hypothetical protein
MARIAKKKESGGIVPLALAKERMVSRFAAFANEAFFTARVMRFKYGEREFFACIRPDDGASTAASALLQIGPQTLQIAVTNISECGLLDERLSKLAFEIYPNHVKSLLFDLLLHPLVSSISAWAGEPVEIKSFSFKLDDVKKSLPFRCAFRLYEENPFAGKEVKMILNGTLAAGETLANRFIDGIRNAAPIVPYRVYERAIPPCHNVVSSLRMSQDEACALRVGDVVLLENSEAVSGGARTLVGIAPYTIECKQNGAQMTVLKLRKDGSESMS